MQQIIIKEIKGPLGKGEKKFYAIVDDKGGEFTSFDTKVANIKPGSVLEAEVEVSGKYINLKEWKVISEPAPETTNGLKPYKRDTGGIEFEYLWRAKLQKVERESIEAQVGFKGIIDLAVAKIIPLDNPNLIKALEWAKARLEGTAVKPIPAPQLTKSVPSGVKAESDSKVFANLGTLLQWCAENGVNRAKFMEIIQVTEKDLSKVNIVEAHQAILDYLKEHPVNPNDPKGL